MKKNISPFKPKKYIKFKPKNFNVYTFNAGFKKTTDDLLVIVFKNLANFSSVYTNSSMPAAPIIWNKKYKNNKCKILIVNSGNANAFTGIDGIEEINKYVKFVSKKFKCKKNQVLVASTGVIGEKLNSKFIISTLNKNSQIEPKNILDAAKAIMTTDTYPKVAEKIIKIGNQKFKIFGIAKGSGMISPKMATMLSFIFIEIPLNKIQLNKILKDNIDETFNSITVDGDTSTNDMTTLFSTKKEDNKKLNKKTLDFISKELKYLMHNLSKQIVCDGEGISKLISVNVVNAKSKNQAKKIAFSIAESNLVKTAIYGKDANWGRIIMAIGKSNEKLDINKMQLKFGKNIVAEKGKASKKINIKNLNKYMKRKIIDINLNLNSGKYNKTILSSDLTNEYVDINADYRS